MTRSIPEEIAALQKLSFEELRVRYATIFGRPARGTSRDYLWKRCAWGLQAERHGGLSDAAQAKLAELDAAIDLPVEVTTVVKKRTLPVGTVIRREWRLQQIEVVVTEAGFEWNGIPFGSLSAVAKAITGVAWNGPVFFGLKERKRK